MKSVKRETIEEECCQEIFKKESHHTHEIIEMDDGVFRWKPNDNARIFLENISLNDLCPLLSMLGYDKNSEVYRKLYRDLGYSLFGYWEIFYWDENNPDAENYGFQDGQLSNLGFSLPTKDEVINKGFNIANAHEYNCRRVLRETDNDVYYSGWMDCFDWINDNK